MTLQVRRVVTGHDKDGKAIVMIDENVKNVISTRPRAESSVIWSTDQLPASNDGDHDPSPKSIGTTIDNGSVFRVLRLEPGNAPRMHRTDSIDYAVIMDGEIDMELEPGQFVHLKAGDVLVQRGTVHNWVNRGTAPCTIAFVLISAKSVTVNGKALEAHG